LAWAYLFGDRTVNIYKALFLICGFIGTIVNLDLVLEFSDILLLAMSLPNLLGCFILSGVIAKELDNYMSRLKSGAMLTEVAKTREPVLK
jgi:AGCS family alanine or glycine:cation symporter